MPRLPRRNGASSSPLRKTVRWRGRRISVWLASIGNRERRQPRSTRCRNSKDCKVAQSSLKLLANRLTAISELNLDCAGGFGWRFRAFRQDGKTHRFEIALELCAGAELNRMNPERAGSLNIDLAIVYKQGFRSRNAEAAKSVLVDRGVGLD